MSQNIMNERTKSYVVFFAFLLLIPFSLGSILIVSCGPLDIRALPTSLFLLAALTPAFLTAASVVGAAITLFRLFAKKPSGREPVISGTLGRYFLAGVGVLLLALVFVSRKMCN